MAMTSRERVNAALDHREPDRVPIDCGGTDVTGLHGMAYHRLKRHLGIAEGETRLFHVYMQLAAVEESVRTRFSGDVVRLSIETKRWKAWTLADGSPCTVPEAWNPVRFEDGSEALLGGDGQPLIKRLPSAPWFSPCGPICPLIQSPEDIEQYGALLRMLDRSPWFDETIEDVAERARRLRAETDYAIAGIFGGHIFAQCQLIRGMDHFMCDLLVNEDLARTLMDTIAESHIEEFARYIKVVGPYIDLICIADDLGAQGGPQLDPALFRRVVKPYMAKLYGFMKRRMGNAKLFLHSCGSVYDFVPDLIEMGVDVLNPVQVSAANMDSAKLKAEFGQDITFWGGGCDTQTVLPLGSRDEVRNEVTRRLDDWAPNGGYVFTQVHNIQPGVPPENIEAMFDTALEHGVY
ncbi:MAG TPA: uroporphyrinogen decarboxylase family protein [Candidatus Hydrogenedentes bacterium]|nr:uroporphyrinogen decarboxylase family protein [Candidatus Hydrogenedentota bacterium]HPG69723.1 uroporphyrinogen decarboxylase family protein [Candidatus Hydrogenedentota bacterium]